MVALLPPELLDLIQQKCPCRDTQIRQLATYYNNTFPSPPILVAYGLEQSSKRQVINSVLQAREIAHTIIKSKECLSQRHLLSKIFAASITTLGHGGQIEQYEKTDNINSLLGNLRKLFERLERVKFVVILEDADELRQPGPTLLPALARLGDLIPGFSILLTSNSPRPLNLHRAGVPYVHFPPYTRSEAISIVVSHLQSPISPGHESTVEVDETALRKLYPQFAATVYDSLISSTSSTSIQSFQSTCDRLWPRFIEPILSLKKPAGNTKSWTFPRLLVHHRGLFQSDGESALYSRLTERPVLTTNQPDSLSPPPDPSTHRPPLLKHFTTLILLSAYLASHTQQKYDILLFSRMSSSSSGKKVRRSRQTPTKTRSPTNPSATPTKEAGTPSKTPRSKSMFSATANLGVPRPFALERLVAILRAIHPHGVAYSRGVTDRVCRELGELEKLRLVVRLSSPGGSVAASDDATDEKWRVNVGRDWVVNMGQAWGMGVSEYEIDQDA
ncbi:hypothetical protein H2200_000744 [Cladophialophora chaetospira]|uniref:Origin recognition complex subunit Orc5 n=1 Tax=Cladophialophora chaetospira TaxID=386627 RepID=A0AA38XNZ6_9EURO|nr:hypothetical protein H2200_000744 [Cladophialophora chaetospira]